MQIGLIKITEKDLCYRSIKRLKDWRIKNKSAYLGTYEITQQSVRKWLKECVLDKKDRILYWVMADRIYVGHMGLNNIKVNSVEIDNVSRGVDKYKGIMHTALQMLIDDNRKERVYLRVLRENKHAIEFYEKNRFKREKFADEFLIMRYE